MENKKTTVDWLFEQIFKDIDTDFVDKLKIKAKEMEKRQIKDAYKAGCVDEMWELKDTENEEHYYNKTYVTNAE
jgi:hypothetical protein